MLILIFKGDQLCKEKQQSHQLPEVSLVSKEKTCNSNTKTIKNNLKTQYCTCANSAPAIKLKSQTSSASYRINYKLKDRNSTITEDPQSIEDSVNVSPTLNSSTNNTATNTPTNETPSPNKTSPKPILRSQLSKNSNVSFGNSGFRTMAHRLSGFFRKFSIASASTNINSSSTSPNDSEKNSGPICTNCNRSIKPKNFGKKSHNSRKPNNKSLLQFKENIDEHFELVEEEDEEDDDDEENDDDPDDKENDKKSKNPIVISLQPF